MNSDTIAWLALVVSFLGGGVASAVITALVHRRRDEAERRLAYLRRQVEELYGPLSFLTNQNGLLFSLYARLHEAYGDEYLKKDWSDDPSTQRTLKAETTVTLETANKYIHIVERNNESILALLTQKSFLLDASDTEIVNEFLIDMFRLKTECRDGGSLALPHRVYDHLGDISFMRPKFIDAIKERYERKVKDLRKQVE